MHNILYETFREILRIQDSSILKVQLARCYRDESATLNPWTRCISVQYSSIYVVIVKTCSLYSGGGELGSFPEPEINLKYFEFKGPIVFPFSDLYF